MPMQNGIEATTKPGERTWMEHRRARLEAVADLSALGALVAALAVVVLLASAVPVAWVAVAWAALVVDLVVLRRAWRGLRTLVEAVPASLPAWERGVEARPTLG